MNFSTFHKNRFVGIHLLFWIIIWFFFVYFFSYNSDDTRYATWFSGFLLPVTMLTTYFVVYYLIPKYLLTRKIFYFILYGFYTLILSTYLIVITIIGSFVFLSDLKIAQMPPMSRNYIFILILVYLVVAMVSFVTLLNHNFKTVSKNKELQNKILVTQLQLKNQELQYLKSQIHPHFLFNTLNTIYGLALKQSNDTPEIILKLSNLLDYILYQLHKPKVNLSDDIAHIKEYVALEKIRFQDTLKVEFYSDDIPRNLQIPPMLLIPFVENAFKHGNIIDGYLTIDINITLRNGELNFNIKNSAIKEAVNLQKGIGLDNVKKRLELLYKDQYNLLITQEDQWFNVNLKVTV